MKTSSVILNICLVIVIAALTYVATLYLNQRKPDVVVVTREPAAQKMEAGATLPDFEFKAGLQTYKISDFKGKTIILNFWASWCPPCIKEFPEFIKAAQAYPDDIVFIALSSDLDEEKMNSFVQKLGEDVNAENILIAFDKEQSVTRGQFNIYKLPETFLIGTNMQIKTQISGADWTYKDLDAQLQEILKP